MSPAIFPIWILSAGQGSRIGQSKGLQLVDGIPWLQHIIEQYSNLGGTSAWIVLGADVELYFQALSWLPQSDEMTKYKGIEVHMIINHHWQEGQFSSIQQLAKQCSEDQPVWIFPVDGILPKKETLLDLQQFHPQYKVVIPTYHGKGGHPVLVDHFIWYKFILHDLKDPRSRLDSQLRQLPDQLVYRPATDDQSVLSNLNTKSDWKELIE